VNNNKNKCR